MVSPYTIPYLSLRDVLRRHRAELITAATTVIDSGRYLCGDEVAAFETAFARYTGAACCVGVGNGLDALTLILLALKQREGWADGDEVIVPAMTFVATAEAVSRAALRPVFCDVDAHFLLDAEGVEPLVTPRTRALLPVHLYGREADMAALAAVAEHHHLLLVEDAAQAHGAVTFTAERPSVAAAFSFYPGKNLGALGDGGAVVTHDAALAAQIRALANYGATRRYHHEWQGINSRLDELQAAFLRVRLAHLDADNRRRRAIAALYNAGIRHADVAVPYEGMLSGVYHIYPLMARRRDALQQHLAAHGIETLVHYPVAVHRQPVYAAYHAQHFPRAEQVAADELSLPIGPTLTDDDVHTIIQAINTFGEDTGTRS